MLAIALIPSGGCRLVAEATCTSACHTSLEATVGESKRWCKKPPFSACQWPWRSRLHGVTIRRCHCRVRLPCIGGRPILPSLTWVQWPSEAAAANIDTLVSRDLEILAPVVERFADLVEIPLPHMENILKDHKNKALDNSESSWRNVTCEWLRANRALWESWIPDESETRRSWFRISFFLKRFQPAKNLGKIFPSWRGNSISSGFFSWLRNAFLASGSTIPCWRSTPMIGIRPMPLCARRDKFEREACVGLVCVFWFLLFELLLSCGILSYPILSYPILPINLSIHH